MSSNSKVIEFKDRKNSIITAFIFSTLLMRVYNNFIEFGSCRFSNTQNVYQNWQLQPQQTSQQHHFRQINDKASNITINPCSKTGKRELTRLHF